MFGQEAAFAFHTCLTRDHAATIDSCNVSESHPESFALQSRFASKIRCVIYGLPLLDTECKNVVRIPTSMAKA